MKPQPLLLLLLVPACSDASFRVQMPAAFHDEHPKVSVVGVYREGRLSPDAFEQVAPAVEGALGRGCEQGFGEGLRAADPTLYEELDQEARQDGVSDEVLARLSPGALGDTLMVIQLYGPIPLPPGKQRGRGGASAPLPTTPQSYSRGPGSMGGRAPRGSAEDPRASGAGSDVQIAATLYSRKDRVFVGEIALTYSGKDVDAALRKFAQRLSEEMKGAHCAGWTWPPPA